MPKINNYFNILTVLWASNLEIAWLVSYYCSVMFGPLAGVAGMAEEARIAQLGPYAKDLDSVSVGRLHYSPCGICCGWYNVIMKNQIRRELKKVK